MHHPICWLPKSRTRELGKQSARRFACCCLSDVERDFGQSTLTFKAVDPLVFKTQPPSGQFQNFNLLVREHLPSSKSFWALLEPKHANRTYADDLEYTFETLFQTIWLQQQSVLVSIYIQDVSLF